MGGRQQPASWAAVVVQLFAFVIKNLSELCWAELMLHSFHSFTYFFKLEVLRRHTSLCVFIDVLALESQFTCFRLRNSRQNRLTCWWRLRQSSDVAKIFRIHFSSKRIILFLVSTTHLNIIWTYISINIKENYWIRSINILFIIAGHMHVSTNLAEQDCKEKETKRSNVQRLTETKIKTGGA